MDYLRINLSELKLKHATKKYLSWLKDPIM